MIVHRQKSSNALSNEIPGAPLAWTRPTGQPSMGELRRHLLYQPFGLTENPFGVTPNPRYLYETRTHREAKSSLIVGLECGMGFQALIAPPGMGKTTILFYILQRFKDVALTAFLFQLQGTSADFLSYLLTELGGKREQSDVVGTQDAINQLLVQQFRKGRPVILVIDESQHLGVDTLETIRLLSNFETESEKLVQIILAGQPQLGEQLASPELAQLRQRISLITTLKPLTCEEVHSYIEYRLAVAGYAGSPLFAPDAVRAIWQESQGVPRSINMLCFNALLLAGSREAQIDKAIIAEVIADRNLPQIGQGPAAGPKPFLPMPEGDAPADHKNDFAVSEAPANTNIETDPPHDIIDVPRDSPRTESLDAEPPAHGASGPVNAAELPSIAPSSIPADLGEIDCASPLSGALRAALDPPPVQIPADSSNNLERMEAEVDGFATGRRRRWTIVAACCIIVLLGLIAAIGHLAKRRVAVSSAQTIARPAAPLAISSPSRGPSTPDYGNVRDHNQPSAELSKIQHFSTATSTMITVLLGRQVQYEAFRLNGPTRIYFDLQNTHLSAELTGKPMPVSELAISRIRVAQHDGDITRLALVTNGLCQYSARFALHPARLIIELTRTPSSETGSRLSVGGLSSNLGSVPFGPAR